MKYANELDIIDEFPLRNWITTKAMGKACGIFSLYIHNIYIYMYNIYIYIHAIICKSLIPFRFRMFANTAQRRALAYSSEQVVRKLMLPRYIPEI